MDGDNINKEWLKIYPNKTSPIMDYHILSPYIESPY